jgi:DNA-binding XRE family transcriptional regulator
VKRAKQNRLERAGWRVGTASDFLELTPEEVALVEMKLALAAHLRALRGRLALTQAQAARRIGSSQSRIAKMESADPSVSLDLLIRALLMLGATREQLVRTIAARAA